VGFVFYLVGQYKHIFIRKIITGGQPYILIDKAKEYKDKKTGVIYWKLLKAKHTISRPPARAIHPTDKGTYCVEAYYLGDINYKYSISELDDNIKEDLAKFEKEYDLDIQENIKDIVKAKLLDLKKKSIFDLLTFKPTPAYVYSTSKPEILQNDRTITTNERLLAYDQIKAAYERKHKGISQYIPMIAGIAALVILIAVVFIFGGDLIKPMVELNQRNAQVTDSIAEIARSLDNTAKILAGVIQERQYITADTGGTVALLNRTAPN
jgi:hypothetical protein